MSDSIAEDKWESLVNNAHEYLSEIQGVLMKDYSLGEHKRFDWNQETETLAFSSDSDKAVVAKV